MRIRSHMFIRRSDVFRLDFSGKAKSVGRRQSEELTEIHFDDMDKSRTVVVDIPDSIMPHLIKAYEKRPDNITDIPRFLHLRNHKGQDHDEGNS